MRIQTLLLLLFLGGCAVGPNPNDVALGNLPQHYRHFDAELAWGVRDTPSGAVVDGVIKNVRYAYLTNIEVYVALLDQQGKEASRSVGYVVPVQLPMDQSASFSVKLKRAAPPGSRLRFTYVYYFNEGGDTETPDQRWQESFESVVPPR
ncbi:FxLYD domain-containing protein [Geomesophilobacter sediminis]|uniref:Lipoprotein n=1 Tax=Geomesophilobacter sediminis TaxID=2798584 RepID=A0A8J7LYQ9_9BACT|nr:FxLYD domain-containing protein [Geomesophilobacter sediminis]MBJ6725416.1 hypothetical protein [Geomesophilobacter sediminis]